MYYKTRWYINEKYYILKSGFIIIIDKKRIGNVQFNDLNKKIDEILRI